MILAHLTLPTRDVERTTAFFERTLGYRRKPVPSNSPVDVSWLDVGEGQEIHVFFVAGRLQLNPKIQAPNPNALPNPKIQANPQITNQRLWS